MNNQISYFNINWFSETDGPGKRIVLFLQGCSLDCIWCHSPHSQPNESHLLYFDSLCIHCHRCEDICRQGVHSFEQKKHIITRELCSRCGSCIEACPQSSVYKQGNALSLPTKRCDVDTLFETLKPQLEFLGDNGGITFSGGEPLLQAESLTMLAKKCKDAGFHTALETSGIVSLKSVEMIEPYIDVWMFGMRLTTGTQNRSTEKLENQTRNTFRFLLDDKKASVIVRIPAIAGYTNTTNFMDKVQSIIGNSPIQRLEVLPHNEESSLYYHASGIKPKIDYSKTEANKAYQMVTNYFM